MRTAEPIDLDTLPASATLTTRELAEATRLNLGTLRNEIAAGRGPKALRFGRALRFRVADVVEWLNRHAES